MLNDRTIDFCQRVLKFWFSNNRWTTLDQLPEKNMPITEADAIRWFRVSKEFDQQIRDNFQDDLIYLINNDDYDQYSDDSFYPVYILACVIVLDQFPRNMYRGDARAFAFDSKAKELGESLIHHQGDKKLPYVERIFINLPFEHSENLDDQNRAVRYFQELYEEARNDPCSNEHVYNFIKHFIEKSQQHRDLIKEFGRFPHRNAVLKRQARESEEIYLRNGGERFGQ
ncbi:hypothetical protein I4U23_013743 [Adineta vaga]|nr:hypothetical protein I4U23_013743 [Adineta vaga]